MTRFSDARSFPCAHWCAVLFAFVIWLVAARSEAQDPGGGDAVSRGRYLADAGNCVSCHTRAGGEPYAGGVPFETPYGTIYSSNITPDTASGIGSWTRAEVKVALKTGVGKDGTRLFPAFPYPSFTKITDEDADALYAFLKTLKPVRYSPPGNGWIFSLRWLMASWNSLYFEEATYQPDKAQSAEWNRGAYLVQGLGHCGACHSPRNWMMAEDASRSMSGGTLTYELMPGKSGTWSAVNLTSAKAGLAAWSVTDLAKYLQTGFSPRAGAFGPMNEVIANSLSKLSKEDTRAMAVYLKSLPALDVTREPVQPDQLKAGEAVYKARCEKCHGASGRGGIFSSPPVAGSSITQSDDPASLVNIILYGPQLHEGIPTGSWEGMPAYRDILTDMQTAAVANYLRGSWGNRAGAVTEKDVAKQR
jgi:alcohol dehydrogenase (quinone), cytochrome c subunit